MNFQIIAHDSGCSVAGDYDTLESAREQAVTLYGPEADTDVYISDIYESEGQIPVVPIPAEALSPGSKIWYYPFRNVIVERKGVMREFQQDTLKWQDADHEEEEVLLDDGYQEVSREFLETKAKLRNHANVILRSKI